MGALKRELSGTCSTWWRLEENNAEMHQLRLRTSRIPEESVIKEELCRSGARIM